MDSRSEGPQARRISTDAAAVLRAALADTRFTSVDWVSETGSTNRDLLDQLRAGRERASTESAPVEPAEWPSPAVLVTDHQTAGRGTKGRTWFDPPGGSLLMSVRLHPTLAPSRLHLLTMALSLAAAGACAEVAAVEVGLKWPNDLFVGERKLAGVLAESSVRRGVVEALVIGIGLNVNWPAEVPAALREVAVALNQLAGRDIDRVALAAATILGFEAQLVQLAALDGAEALLARYRARSATLGRHVRVELPEGPVVGQAVDIAGDGQLVVDIDGRRRAFAAADVTHLRPA